MQHIFAIAIAALVVGGSLSVACRSRDEQLERPTPSPRAELQDVVADQSQRILSLDVNVCTPFDPALDLWTAGNGIGAPPLVPEIHAGIARFTGDDANPTELDLAASWSASDAATEYTFKLKADIRFSDGSPVLAQHFAWSWWRALAIGAPGGIADRYLGAIVGAQDVLHGNAAALVGVRVADDVTIQVDLRAPDPQFLTKLAHPVAVVLEPGNANLWSGTWLNGDDPYDFDAAPVVMAPERLPVGAGPFRLTEYRTGYQEARCVLGRNEHYHGHAPALDYVILQDRVSATDDFGWRGDELRDLFDSGEIDVDAFVLPRLDTDTIAALDAGVVERVDDVRRIEVPISMALLALRPVRPPLEALDFRRALLDASDIVSEIYGGPYPLPDRLIPPALARMTGDVAVNRPSLAAHGRSRALAVGAGRGPFTINDVGPSDRFNYDGYLANLTELWYARHRLDFRLAGRGDSTPPAPEADALLWEFTVQTPDPLEVLWRFGSLFAGAPADSARATARALISDASREADAAVRRSLMAQAEQVILEEALGAVLHWDVGWSPVRVQPYVHGLTGATFPRSLFKDVWLDDSAPVREVSSPAPTPR